jgi:hypothetical protein
MTDPHPKGGIALDPEIRIRRAIGELVAASEALLDEIAVLDRDLDIARGNHQVVSDERDELRKQLQQATEARSIFGRYTAVPPGSFLGCWEVWFTPEVGSPEKFASFWGAEAEFSATKIADRKNRGS